MRGRTEYGATEVRRAADRGTARRAGLAIAATTAGRTMKRIATAIGAAAVLAVGTAVGDDLRNIGVGTGSES